MAVRKRDAKEEEISGKGEVLDYPIGEEFGVSFQKIDGRVPEEGFYVNEECHEVCFVKSGRVEVVIEGEKSELEEGDVFVIEPRQKHYFQARNLEMVVFTSPDWFEEQCRIVD